MHRFKFILILTFLFQHLFAQENITRTYPTDFRPPLDLPPSSAGSFGELRSNHFHSGLDYRTNQREGYPVYAVADGYVSRLRVQVGGFGNAVYITHPNGYTSVYAHLQRFNERISLTVNACQTSSESYDVDFPLIPIEIPVKKGEIIAWSGNTGSSGGPHLHFEFRDTHTEETINPQLFGFEVPDRVKPVITGMYVYQLNNRDFNENTPRQYFQISGSGGNYKLNQDPVINVGEKVGFGVITYDMNSASQNHNGVYSITLKLDNETIYHAEWDRFFFHHSRGINSHIDYPVLLTSRRRIQKSFVEPGNPLTIYKKLINNGLVSLRDNNIHQLRYEIKDVRGNTSYLNFRIRYNASLNIPVKETPGITRFSYNTANEFTNENVRISMPAGVLYSNIDFRYSTSPAPQGGYSAIHHIHTRLIPVHDGYSLSIKPHAGIPEYLLKKALIVNTQKVSQGGDYVDGFIKTTARTFGSFYIAADTVPPVIRPVNITDGKSMRGTNRIVFKISDNLSGIRSFRGTLNGKWILMQFDLKTATLWYTFDDKVLPGKNKLQLEVTDMKSNSKSYSATFIR
ncbi:MAG TPA: M23 family metallopeptidase [Sphingobacteriaceae bacterium]